MKSGAEAERQYVELQRALRSVDAAWLVEEVEDWVAAGKSVLRSSLPPSTQDVVREKLEAEVERGVAVGRMSKSDEVTVEFTVEERLAMLIDAADRVIVGWARVHEAVVRRAEAYGMREVRFEQPLEFDQVRSVAARTTEMEVPRDLERRLSTVRSLLERAGE